jgi:hypothetical protein
MAQGKQTASSPSPMPPLSAVSIPGCRPRSPIIKQLVDAKQLKIVAAMHDVTTGKVSWLS